jgi:hypothetical protein
MLCDSADTLDAYTGKMIVGRLPGFADREANRVDRHDHPDKHEA